MFLEEGGGGRLVNIRCENPLFWTSRVQIGSLNKALFSFDEVPYRRIKDSCLSEGERERKTSPWAIGLNSHKSPDE